MEVYPARLWGVQAAQNLKETVDVCLQETAQTPHLQDQAAVRFHLRLLLLLQQQQQQQQQNPPQAVCCRCRRCSLGSSKNTSTQESLKDQASLDLCTHPAAAAAAAASRRAAAAEAGTEAHRSAAPLPTAAADAPAPAPVVAAVAAAAAAAAAAVGSIEAYLFCCSGVSHEVLLLLCSHFLHCLVC